MVSCKSKKRGGVPKQLFFAVLLVVAAFSFRFDMAQAKEEMLLVPIYIEEGISLIHLTEKYCTSKYHWKEIAQINNLTEPYKIYEGDTVKIPLELLKKKIASARISSIVGSVYRLQSDDGSLQPVKEGEKIGAGETLVTGEDGFAYLVLSDNRFIRISSNSQFTFTYLFQLEDKSLKAEFFLENGNVSIDVRRKLGKNETMQTRTPISITGVRGTFYRVKMDGDTSAVETLRGNVALSAAGSMVMVKEGKGSLVKDGAPPSAPQKLPPAPPVPAMKKVYREPGLRIASPQVKEGHCRLRICSDKAGETTVWTAESTDGKDFLIVGLEDGEYYAFFTTINAQGLEGLPTAAIPFLLRTVPGAPVLSSPYDGRQLFDPAFTFRWLKGKGDAGYRVQVASDKEFTNLLAEEECEDTEYTYQNAAPGTYHFRAQAVADDGFCSNYSLADSVEIKELPEFGPIPPVAAGEKVVLRWQGMGDGVFYDDACSAAFGGKKPLDSGTGAEGCCS